MSREGVDSETLRGRHRGRVPLWQANVSPPRIAVFGTSMKAFEKFASSSSPKTTSATGRVSWNFAPRLDSSAHAILSALLFRDVHRQNTVSQTP